MVEFAFVLPLLLFLVLGIVDFGRALNYWIDETHLVNEAARYAVVSRDAPQPAGCPLSNNLPNNVKCQADTRGLYCNLTLTVNRDYDGNGVMNVGEPLEVRSQFTMNWFLSKWMPAGFGTTPIRSGAIMRIEVTPPVGTSLTQTSDADGSC